MIHSLVLPLSLSEELTSTNFNDGKDCVVFGKSLPVNEPLVFAYAICKNLP